MYPHHTASIGNVTAHFRRDPETLALLLGGSDRPRLRDPHLRHRRHRSSSPTKPTPSAPPAATSTSSRASSAPTRAATSTANTSPAASSPGSPPAAASRRASPSRAPASSSRGSATSRPPSPAIARYPVEDKAARIRRFYAQFEAWAWYAGEALRLDNAYLLGVSIDKLVLFGGRLILAHNEQLYPYHKWFLRVLETVPDRPAGLMRAHRRPLPHRPAPARHQGLLRHRRNLPRLERRRPLVAACNSSPTASSTGSSVIADTGRRSSVDGTTGHCSWRFPCVDSNA